MFDHLDRLRPDAILGLMAQFRADPFPHKVDLGVGVFRDLSGNTPVLASVRRAEATVLEAQTTKSYVAAAGREEYNEAVTRLVLGESHLARRDRRARIAQTPGGCGALRVGAELIRAAAPAVTVHVSDPTWGNHAPLLGSSGLKLERYPYYDAAAHQLRFDAMLERLERAPPGDVVLVHACCHNPTGADLSLDQWRMLTELLAAPPPRAVSRSCLSGFRRGSGCGCGRSSARERDAAGGADRRIALQEPRALPRTGGCARSRSAKMSHGPMPCRAMCCKSPAASTRCRRTTARRLPLASLRMRACGSPGFPN